VALGCTFLRPRRRPGVGNRRDHSKGLRAVEHRLDVVAVGIPDIGGVVALGVLHPDPRRAPVATTVRQRRRIESVDRLVAERIEGHVRAGGRLGTGEDGEVVHALGAERDPVGVGLELHDP
jgi:hypothetical protein